VVGPVVRPLAGDPRTVASGPVLASIFTILHGYATNLA
jgi:hypothetical protein